MFPYTVHAWDLCSLMKREYKMEERLFDALSLYNNQHFPYPMPYDGKIAYSPLCAHQGSGRPFKLLAKTRRADSHIADSATTITKQGSAQLLTRQKWHDLLRLRCCEELIYDRSCYLNKTIDLAGWSTVLGLDDERRAGRWWRKMRVRVRLTFPQPYIIKIFTSFLILLL